MAKNQDAQMGADEAFEDVGDEPRVYELGFHINPELPVEEVKKVYGAVRKDIEEKGAIVAEGEPQRIPLAYTISYQETAGRRDFDSAYFSWIVYETSAKNHAEVVAAVGANKNIIRFIDLLTTKDAARHASEIREIALKTPEREEESVDTAANVELDTALERVVV